MPMQIPKRYIPGLKLIFEIPGDTVDKLVTEINASKPSQSAEALADAVAMNLPSIEKADLLVVLETVYALHNVREFAEISASRFLADLIQAMKNAKILSDKSDAKEARIKFQKLMSVENISVLSKALKLQRSGERLYCGSQILSDIRAVFHNDVNALPAVGVISHTLKLEYHENHEHKEFFVILESDDLNELKEVIERAQTKETTLQKILVNAGLQDLSV